MLPNLRSFIKRQTSGTSSDNEWQRVRTSGITSDKEWYNEWQQVVQRVVQRVTTNDNEWQRITMSGCFGLFSFFFEKILLIGTQKRTLYTLRKTLKRTFWIKSRFSKSSCSLEDILTVRSKYRNSFFLFVTLTISKICKDYMA